METIVYSFNKEALFNRCKVDISLYGEHSEQQIEMCEHDQNWFDVTLCAASCVVMTELSRIAKGIDTIMLDDPYDVVFQAKPISTLQNKLLPEAIERYLIHHVINSWYTQKLRSPIVDISQSLSHLKHITLMNNCVGRSPNY